MTFLEKIKIAEKLIKESIKKYPKIAAACSFGKDSMVLIHLAQSVKKDIPTFTVMTPFKFKETFEYKDRMIKKYKMNIKEYKRTERKDKLTWWEADPDACCNYYKVEPTKEAVGGLDAWFAGLRRSEGNTRADLDYVVKKGNLVKINPILDFTELDVWRYLTINEIPVNPMYKEGYRSLGCKYCSNPEKDERESERAGRWLGTSKCGGECGIHSKTLK
jgi:phosphoadenosine phosphosulfate reductase